MLITIKTKDFLYLAAIMKEVYSPNVNSLVPVFFAICVREERALMALVPRDGPRVSIVMPYDIRQINHVFVTAPLLFKFIQAQLIKVVFYWDQPFLIGRVGCVFSCSIRKKTVFG